MKILHVCTMDSMGAGKAMARIHQRLKKVPGIQSDMLVIDRTTDDKGVTQFIKSRDFTKFVRYKFYVMRVFSRIGFYQGNYSRERGLFSDDRMGFDISNHSLVREADLIHLGWTTFMINIGKFFTKVRKPLIWHLSDSNPFTGGCHVPGDCVKYAAGCGACPLLGSDDPLDLSRKIFERKLEAYKSHNIRVVAPSSWIASSARKSTLFRNYKIDLIPNALSPSTYNKKDRESARALLRLPRNKTLILFGSAYADKNKGMRYLVDAMKLLEKTLDVARIGLVLFGKYDRVVSVNKKITLHHLGCISDESKLAHVYSAADMCVVPSLQETFGQIALESMSCGTPVICFNVSALPEIVRDHVTGLTAKSVSASDLAKKIEHMILHPQERETMGRSARRMVENEYTLDIQAERYLRLIQSMLNAKQKPG